MFVCVHVAVLLLNEPGYTRYPQASHLRNCGTPFLQNHKTPFMKGTITTLLVGIVIGILIAPEKGSVIRQKIVDLIDDLSEAGHHLAEKPGTSGLSDDLS
jgi:hypothetical protein